MLDTAHTFISIVFHHNTGGRPAVSSNPKTIFLTKSYTPRYRYRKKEYANHLPEPGVVIRDLIAIQAIFVDLVARFRQGVLLLLMKVAKVYNGGRTTGANDLDVVLRVTRTLSLVRSLLENMQGILTQGQPADWVEWQNDVQWAFVAPYLSQLAFLEAQKSWCTVNTNQRLEARVTDGLINYDKSPAGISCHGTVLADAISELVTNLKTDILRITPSGVDPNAKWNVLVHTGNGLLIFTHDTEIPQIFLQIVSKYASCLEGTTIILLHTRTAMRSTSEERL